MSPLITSPSGGPSVGRVVVVGSANVDRTLMVDRFPEPGQTIMGAPVVVGQGGKGANQAVAASRMGARVAFVGAVGQDDDGQAVVDALAAEGVDVEAVLVGLQELDAPVLVVGGERDALTGVASVHAVAASFRDAQTAVIPRAGHFPWVDEPGAFQEVVAAFVRER